MRRLSRWKNNQNQTSQSGSFYNYEVSVIGAKLADGLGKTIQPSSLDIIIIESSGHNKAENVPHTLDNTIKLLKSSTDALKSRINMYLNAHFESRPTLHARHYGKFCPEK
jgi:hypothetical protein